MTDRPINVFFDASSLIKVGMPPGKETFWRLVDLVDYGFITVVTTDLTKNEIARHHADNAYGTLSPLSKSGFRQLAAKFFEIELPGMSEPEVRDKIRRKMDDGVGRMFRSLKAKVLDVDQVQPSIILGDYDRGEKLFGDKNKKNQFPDAFIFECLKGFASADDPVVIVADDPDFKEPANKTDHVSFVDSIQGLFDALGLVQDEPDPDLEPFLYGELFSDSDFLAYVEHDDWEFDDYRVTLGCASIDFDSITAFKQIDESAPLLVSADVTVMLDVDIEHRDGQSDHKGGNGKVSFYASVILDERGSPKVLSDLRVFKCTLDWGHTSVMFAF